MTGMILLFAMLALLLVIWVLRRNARDRERFEKELEEELREDHKSGDHPGFF